MADNANATVNRIENVAETVDSQAARRATDETCCTSTGSCYDDDDVESEDEAAERLKRRSVAM